MPEPHLRVDEPGELLAAMPSQLGFYPSDSIVVIMLQHNLDDDGGSYRSRFSSVLVIRICQPSSVVASRDLSANSPAAAVPLARTQTTTLASSPMSPAFVLRVRMNTPRTQIQSSNRIEANQPALQANTPKRLPFDSDANTEVITSRRDLRDLHSDRDGSITVEAMDTAAGERQGDDAPASPTRRLTAASCFQPHSITDTVGYPAEVPER
ncbi:DUF4192 family protein [Nocardia terpenica]|uniref:DUF4192 family protein n=1 Tax=Nocardia terpenica TaxID=455432 RepID=A0A6G9Z7E9_9NOCA|nr:DUF4192 family protein [Nocardia terpenica]